MNQRAIDLTIQDLAADLERLDGAHITAITDAVAYRHLACAALDVLAQLTKERDGLRRRLEDQQQQIRTLMGLTDDVQRQGDDDRRLGC